MGCKKFRVNLNLCVFCENKMGTKIYFIKFILGRGMHALSRIYLFHVQSTPPLSQMWEGCVQKLLFQTYAGNVKRIIVLHFSVTLLWTTNYLDQADLQYIGFSCQGGLYFQNKWPNFTWYLKNKLNYLNTTMSTNVDSFAVLRLKGKA